MQHVEEILRLFRHAYTDQSPQVGRLCHRMLLKREDFLELHGWQLLHVLRGHGTHGLNEWVGSTIVRAEPDTQADRRQREQGSTGRTGCSPRLCGVDRTCTLLSSPVFMMRIFFFCVCGMNSSVRTRWLSPPQRPNGRTDGRTDGRT